MLDEKLGGPYMFWNGGHAIICLVGRGIALGGWGVPYKLSEFVGSLWMWGLQRHPKMNVSQPGDRGLQVLGEVWEWVWNGIQRLGLNLRGRRGIVGSVNETTIINNIRTGRCTCKHIAGYIYSLHYIPNNRGRTIARGVLEWTWHASCSFNYLVAVRACRRGQTRATIWAQCLKFWIDKPECMGWKIMMMPTALMVFTQFAFTRDP